MMISATDKRTTSYLNYYPTSAVARNNKNETTTTASSAGASGFYAFHHHQYHHPINTNNNQKTEKVNNTLNRKNEDENAERRITSASDFADALTELNIETLLSGGGGSSSNDKTKLAAYNGSLFKKTTNENSSSLYIGKAASSIAPSLPPQQQCFNLTIEERLLRMVSSNLIKKDFTKQYTLGKFIRSGGFSNIFEGKHIHTGLDVILKFIPKIRTKNWLKVYDIKFPAEVLLHKAVSDVEGVINFFDFFEEKDCWVIAIEKISNCLDLFDYLERTRRGRLCEDTARHFFKQLVQTNLELCYRGVVHRDIKCENVLVDIERNKLLLIDFGASAILKDTPYFDFHGTKQYRTPEFIVDNKYNAIPSTVWTLGILLYDMVMGRLPFETENDIIQHRILLKPFISDNLKDLISSCLCAQPENRPTLESILQHPWIKRSYTLGKYTE